MLTSYLILALAASFMSGEMFKVFINVKKLTAMTQHTLPTNSIILLTCNLLKAAHLIDHIRTQAIQCFALFLNILGSVI